MNKRRTLKSVDGFKSVYPEEWVKWQYVQKIVEKTVGSFGFKRISPPSVERKSLYEVKPPWSEGLITQTFSFTDNEQNHIALVPEQTPTRARMVQELKKIELPIRWFDTSKRWRQEEKNRDDRAKEFWQTDVDIIGVGSIEADAEILGCAADIYKNLGIDKEIEISINDRKLLENILFAAGVKSDDCYTAVKIVDDKEKICRAEFDRRFRDIGLIKHEIDFIHGMVSLNGPILECVQKIKILDRKIAEKSNQILERLIKLSNLLKWYGVYDMCRLDLSIARGSFYTGIIFEVCDKNKKLGALSGGGRYDWLISMYGKRDLPAVGFGFGYLGTIKKMEEKNLFNLESDKSNIFIACEDPLTDYKTAIKLARILRKKGVIAQIDINIGKKFNCAANSGVSIFLKKNFNSDHLAEIILNGKKKILKIDDLESLLGKIKF